MWFVLRNLIKAATFEHSAICIIWLFLDKHFALLTPIFSHNSANSHLTFLNAKLHFGFHQYTLSTDVSERQGSIKINQKIIDILKSILNEDVLSDSDSEEPIEGSWTNTEAFVMK